LKLSRSRQAQFHPDGEQMGSGSERNPCISIRPCSACSLHRLPFLVVSGVPSAETGFLRRPDQSGPVHPVSPIGRASDQCHSLPRRCGRQSVPADRDPPRLPPVCTIRCHRVRFPGAAHRSRLIVTRRQNPVSGDIGRRRTACPGAGRHDLTLPGTHSDDPGFVAGSGP